MRPNTNHKNIEEFKRYACMARYLQRECNLGTLPYEYAQIDDPLMKAVPIYDAVERKYAGFGQLVLDLTHDSVTTHPYANSMKSKRRAYINRFDYFRNHSGLEDILFTFFVHRLTGSGISYGHKDNGYVNSIFNHLPETKSITEMASYIKSYKGVMYTSGGYYIAMFPKAIPPYNKGGNYYLAEIAPLIIDEFMDELIETTVYNPISFKSAMELLCEINMKHNPIKKNYYFQFGAFLSDIADLLRGYATNYLGDFIARDSCYFVGNNASKSLHTLYPDCKGVKKQEAALMDLAYTIEAKPHDTEDILCDYWRWINSYVPRGKSSIYNDLPANLQSTYLYKDELQTKYRRLLK